HISIKLTSLLHIMLQCSICWKLAVDRQGNNAKVYLWIKHGQQILEKIAALRTVIVNHEHAIDSDAGLTQVGNSACPAFADLRDASAAGKIEVNVALATH